MKQSNELPTVASKNDLRSYVRLLPADTFNQDEPKPEIIPESPFVTRYNDKIGRNRIENGKAVS